MSLSDGVVDICSENQGGQTTSDKKQTVSATTATVTTTVSVHNRLALFATICSVIRKFLLPLAYLVLILSEILSHLHIIFPLSLSFWFLFGKKTSPVNRPTYPDAILVTISLALIMLRNTHTSMESNLARPNEVGSDEEKSILLSLLEPSLNFYFFTYYLSHLPIYLSIITTRTATLDST